MQALSLLFFEKYRSSSSLLVLPNSESIIKLHIACETWGSPLSGSRSSPLINASKCLKDAPINRLQAIPALQLCSPYFAAPCFRTLPKSSMAIGEIRSTRDLLESCLMPVISAPDNTRPCRGGRATHMRECHRKRCNAFETSLHVHSKGYW